MAQVQYYGTGRRKSSVARVRLVPGDGQVLINNRSIDDYFGKKTLEMIVKQPLVLTDTEGRFNVICKVHGGGSTGQAGAIRLGIARALLKADVELRPALKRAGYLTRDPRMKEKKIRLKVQEDLHNSPNVNICQYTTVEEINPRRFYLPLFFHEQTLSLEGRNGKKHCN